MLTGRWSLRNTEFSLEGCGSELQLSGKSSSVLVPDRRSLLWFRRLWPHQQSGVMGAGQHVCRHWSPPVCWPGILVRKATQVKAAQQDTTSRAPVCLSLGDGCQGRERLHRRSLSSRLLARLSGPPPRCPVRSALHVNGAQAAARSLSRQACPEPAGTVCFGMAGSRAGLSQHGLLPHSCQVAVAQGLIPVLAPLFPPTPL